MDFYIGPWKTVTTSIQDPLSVLRKEFPFGVSFEIKEESVLFSSYDERAYDDKHDYHKYKYQDHGIIIKVRVESECFFEKYITSYIKTLIKGVLS